MSPHRFDPARLGRLNDIARLDDLAPGPMWKAFGVPDARLVVELGAGTGMFAREFAAMMKAGREAFRSGLFPRDGPMDDATLRGRNRCGDSADPG